MSMLEGSSAENEGLQQLQQLHRTVERAVRRAVTVYSALEVEAPPTTDATGDFDPCVPRRSTVLGQLPSFYRDHVGWTTGSASGGLRRSTRCHIWLRS